MRNIYGGREDKNFLYIADYPGYLGEAPKKMTFTKIRSFGYVEKG